MTTRADRFTELQKQDELYSDFLTNLNPHPTSGMLLRVVNEHAVTRSIRNLINTDRNERLFQPQIGSDIRKVLFEPMGSATSEILSSLVQETIDKYEPRAKVLKVEVIPNYEQNRYTVNVVYLLINKQDPISVNITLQRVR